MERIYNRTTEKLELHFERAEYNALTETQKNEIKSAFLWSRGGGCWVSRSKSPNLWRARTVAESVGATEEVEEGEKLTFSEKVEREQERADRRADRLEARAENAERNGKKLCADLESHRGDIAFFTQPITNTSGGRAFARYRERLYNRFDHGMDEYRKSEEYKNRAEKARETANGDKYKNPVYLSNRITETKADLRACFRNAEKYEKAIEQIGAGEKYMGEYGTTEIPREKVEKWLSETIERIEDLTDKLAFLQNCVDEIGATKYNPENIKKGYIVKLARWGVCEVVSVGAVNIGYKIMTGGAAGLGGSSTYMEILDVIEEREPKKETHPFHVGEVLAASVWEKDKENEWRGKWTPKPFKIVKTSDVSVTLEDENGKKFTRKPKKNWDGLWYVKVTDALIDGITYKKANA